LESKGFDAIVNQNILLQIMHLHSLNQGVLGSSPRWRTSLNLATMPLQGFLFYSLYFEVTPWL